MRPLVMMSNDDGVGAPYLAALAEEIASLDADVMVVAPERERSAVSHSITLHKPLRVTENEAGRAGWFAVSGSPADCVYIGILKLAPRRPSLVVSGINKGFNLGSDVFYSGTVAAAVEGAIRGIPSVAFSIDRAAHAEVAPGVRFAGSLIRHMLDAQLAPSSLFNVNLPAISNGQYRWTSLGKRVYSDDVQERTDPRGKRYFWIGGGAVESPQQPGSDCQAIDEGVISVTPMHLDLTAHKLVQDAPLSAIDGYALAEL